MLIWKMPGIILDLALESDGDNPSIIHSIGNLHYRQFRNYLDEGNEDRASVQF